ncbi:MAG: replicative DNA helicase [Richelia sp. RM2_1_2]|nr:replicative DNA helicase [Richelia sp. SM2_1_7]NJM19110.1 replicative DNA helicase [Richelia sp. SM1_7_0]NJN11385.1 replicative DNA helicase [Richelia sp. RM1_1_1]NJO28902.1 replicative DNA helicase [Richelia sp. SL_2_1]NJO64595.1 replicative DNA helicase [Richelia sp. RM2_1_2]
MFAKQNKVIDFASFSGKVPPQCIEAEEAILGGILLDPGAIARVRDELKPYHFYIGAHSSIYQAMLKLNEQEQPTDLIVIINYLEANELLASVGGRNKLASLVDRCVSAVNIDALANLVISKWKRRELGRLGNLATELQHRSDDEVSLPQAFEQLQDCIYRLQQGSNNKHTSHISDVMTDVYQKIEERHQGTALGGIPTGFYDLDAVTNGFSPGDLVIVAGRPAMGKSAFAAQIGFNVAQQNRAVALFSLEMSKSQIGMRMLAGVADIENTNLKTGRISDSQWHSIAIGTTSISNLPIYLNDCATPSLNYFEAECRKIMSMERRNLGLVIVDYLQLMGEDGNSNRNHEIAAITRGLKRLAMKLEVPVICLSQLSRAVESRQNKRPVLSDLRDSGGIEQDGDKVLMLYRDEYYSPDSPDRGICEIIIAKHRDGATGTIRLLFDSEYTKFKNLARGGW